MSRGRKVLVVEPEDQIRAWLASLVGVVVGADQILDLYDPRAREVSDCASRLAGLAHTPARGG